MKIEILKLRAWHAPKNKVEILPSLILGLWFLGFFVGYHVSLFSRVTSELERFTLRQVEEMMKELGKSYSFEAYRKDVLERLDHLLKLYNASNGIITVPIWDWYSEEHPEQDIEGSQGSETAHIEQGEVPANLHGTPNHCATEGGDEGHSKRDGTNARMVEKEENGQKMFGAGAVNCQGLTARGAEELQKAGSEGNTSRFRTNSDSNCDVRSSVGPCILGILLDVVKQATRETRSQGKFEDSKEAPSDAALEQCEYEDQRLRTTVTRPTGSPPALTGSTKTVGFAGDIQSGVFPAVPGFQSVSNNCEGSRNRFLVSDDYVSRAAVEPWVLGMLLHVVGLATQGRSSGKTGEERGDPTLGRSLKRGAPHGIAERPFKRLATGAACMEQEQGLSPGSHKGVGVASVLGWQNSSGKDCISIIGSKCQASYSQKSKVWPWISGMVSDIVKDATQERLCDEQYDKPSHALLPFEHPVRVPRGVDHLVFKSKDTEKNECREVERQKPEKMEFLDEGFLNVVQEAATLAKKVKSKVIREEWDVCRRQIYALLTKMKAEE